MTLRDDQPGAAKHADDWCDACQSWPECVCEWDDPGDEGWEPCLVRCDECDYLVEAEDTWRMDDGSDICAGCTRSLEEAT